jgi:chorismate dehydratase
LEQKIRIGAVSYLNTKPMITGLEKWDAITLELDYPANVAKMLLNDEIDIGLIPVAVIPLLEEHYIISDYGIACNGKVSSVCLFSDVPINDIDTILLDYQSRTSVQLLKILLKQYWKKDVAFINAKENFETQINKTTAALIIGDRAFAAAKHHSYCYDLGEVWKQCTGLPFVFATWVSNKLLDEDFIELFNEHIENNIDDYFEKIDKHLSNDFEKTYLQKNIEYFITSDHQKGMDLFLRNIE